MLPGDRLICVFVGSSNLGFTFKDWLLHVTIVPWFRIDKKSDVIAAELETKLRGVGIFFVSLGRENIRFGYQKEKRATLVRLPSQFTGIERIVREYLRDQKAWLVDETTKKHRAFRPHVTSQKSGSMHEGDVFTCDRIYIVEQKGEFKEIVREVRLGVE